MISNARLHIYRLLPVVVFSVFLMIAGCRRSSSVTNSLDAAESLMESRPDSALGILDSIDATILNEDNMRARYALLKSMALDKNYVDTTTFDVLQPAIDYYLKEGSPDEKIRTCYYQGRIYQNRNERDSALLSFMRALDFASECRDSLTLARILVAQGISYKSFYDISGYAYSYLKASSIYKENNKQALEFECLLNALNGMIILDKKEQADSILKVLGKFESLDADEKQRVEKYLLSYTLNFGSRNELNDLINTEKSQSDYDVNGILNLAMAFNRVGDNSKALQHLDYIDKINATYDTLKYLTVKLKILENTKCFEEAFKTYKDYSRRCEIVNANKFARMNRTMEEKHRIELEAEREARDHARKEWWFIGGIMFLAMGIVMLILINLRNKARKDLALQNSRLVELENKNLRTENELVVQKARTAELESERLRAERESLVLENRNLELERDKKALEAENLVHRVQELEGEGESLKEALESQQEMPEEVRKAIRERIEMLNSYLASRISDHKEFEQAYDEWVAGITADTEEFMNSNRLAFQVSHPAFIKYFEDHGLTVSEINYVCLYAIGLRGKDVGIYMRKRSHVNMSSDIRRKLGIDRHETNIGIYVRKLLKKL